MSEAVGARNWFSNPGDSLVAAMRRRGVRSDTLGNALGGTDVLKSLITGSRRIERAQATVLAEFLGGSVDFWLKRQFNFERDLGRAVSAISPEDARTWLSMPMPAHAARQRANRVAVEAVLSDRLKFFGVATLAAWESRYTFVTAQTRFRTSQTFESSQGAMAVWLRQGELEAVLSDTAAWNRSKLAEVVPQVVKLSRIRSPERFLPRLKRLLAEAGVAFVALRAPAECRASGASRLVSPDKAMILASFRHRSDDHFWFTLLHEIGHLVMHGAQPFVEQDEMDESQCEQEANAFAQSAIIPPHSWQQFADLSLTPEAISRFAVKNSVGTGLVLGQLQHMGRVPRDRLNFLRHRWNWHELDAAIATL